MKQLKKRIFAAVLAALMLTTAMPGTALYASAETETVSDNAIGQAGTEETGTEDTGICKHHQEHDADCGYIPKSEDGEGSPCTYECRICPVEDLIADLPDKVTEDVRAQLDKILVLYRELNEDEQEQIDLSRIYALQGALDAANAPTAADGHADQQADDAASVEIDGVTTYYATLEEAFDAANGKTATITMLNDAECVHSGSAGSPLNINGGNVTLNLNGNTLSGVGYGNYEIINVSGGSLLVQGEEGKVNVTGIGLSCRGSGKLTVEGITLELVGSDGFTANAGVANYGGTIILNGTRMTGTACDGQIYHVSGTTTINNVTATGTTENGPESVCYYSEGTLKINGGTFDKIVVDSDNYGGVQSVAGLLGEGCAYRKQGGNWATADDLAAMEISDVTVEKIPLTINPNGDTSWYYSTQQTHTLAMNAAPVDSSDSVTYVWKSGTETLDCTSDACTVPAGTPVGSYTYTCEATCDGYTLSHTFTFKIEQSGTDLTSEGDVKTYNGNTQTTTFSADDTITVKAVPTATGAAPQKAAARLRSDYTAPTAGQMALFVGDVQVSEPVGAGTDGTYTMTVSASEVLLQGNAKPNGNAVTLTAKFVGNDNMADAAGTVDVRISAVAMAEKDGTVIGYYGESNLADAFADSGNADATFTLLADVEPSTYLAIQIDCTLDLNGHTITSHIGRGLCVIVETNTAVTIRGEGEIIAKGGIALAVNGSVTLEGGTYTSGGDESSSVYVMGQSAMLSVTGEKVSIRNTSGGYGLSVAQAQSVRLSAGTYSGTAEAISSTVKLSDMLAHTDNIRYAFYQGSSPYAPSGSSLPSGTFTVKECRHTGVEVTDQGGDKHGLTCPYCGYSYSHDSTTLPALVATADQTANTVTLSEGCDIADCDYRSAVGTVSFAFPKAVYGQTDQAVTLTGIPADYIIICQAEGGNQIQNQDGDTEMSLTLKDLFGSTEITAGDHKLSVWFGGGTTGTFSNKCELTFTIAKADQTPLSITGTPGSVTYGDTFQLAVSGGSGTGSVGWAASGATVDDAGNVTITRAGFVVITAMKEGDSNYTGIEGRITLNVNTASLTVTANDQTIAYGGHIEEGKEQVTVTGLCGSDTLTEITLTPSTENVPGGTGTITPSAAKIQNGSGGDAAANYDITYKTGTLTIGKIQNAPGMPSAVMDNVSNSCQKISDVPLPDGWVWQDSDKNTALEVGVPVSAVAVYNGVDSDYYENVTVTVTVTRSACDHTEGEILYTGAGESAPTCTKAGLGHTVCTKCGAVVRKDIAVPALGHDYDAGEVTKEPTVEAEGERTYTCKRCGHTYTETIPRKEPQGLWIDHMQPSVSYTGAAVKQEQIEVYYGTALLREKVDYTISYKNNSNAGTAQVIVTGKGNYTGKAVETFEIRPIDIGAQPGMTAIVATAVETGKTLKPAVTVTWNGKKLKEKTDYTLSYHTNIKTAGAYEVTVSGTRNYTGSLIKTFVVKPRGTKLLKSAAVSGIKKSYPYPGSGLAADLTSAVVTMGKTTLVKGTEYTVRTENTDVVGTGTVIIEAAQTDAYAGEKRIAVSITGTDLKKGSIKGVEKSYPYTGRPITPQITVYSGRNGTGEVIPADKYIVSYTNSTEQGKATVTATGIPEKGYSGSVKVSYQIGRLNLADEKAAGNLKVIMPADISHAKGGAKPQPVITYTYEGVTRTLREGADYTLKYSNHTTATGSKPPTVKITGKGNYSGNITESFAISKQDIGRLSITVTDRAYGKTRKGSYYYSAPKVYDLDGKQLKSGRDYTVQYTYADSGNPIGKNDKIEPGRKLCAVVAAHEGSSYTGTLSATYVVREAKEVKDIGKVKNDKIENQQYTGSALTPEVRLYTQTGKTKTYLTDEDYEVIGCYNNTKRGTATILVRGKGAYSGVKCVTFRIVQKKIR